MLFDEYGFVRNFIYNLFSDQNFSDKNGQVRNLTDDKLDKVVDNVYLQFTDAIKKAGIYDKFRNKLVKLAKNVEGVKE